MTTVIGILMKKVQINVYYLIFKVSEVETKIYVLKSETFVFPKSPSF